MVIDYYKNLNQNWTAEEFRIIHPWEKDLKFGWKFLKTREQKYVWAMRKIVQTCFKKWSLMMYLEMMIAFNSSLEIVRSSILRSSIPSSFIPTVFLMRISQLKYQAETNLTEVPLWWLDSKSTRILCSRQEKCSKVVSKWRCCSVFVNFDKIY